MIFERAHGVAVEDAAVQLGPVAPLGAEQTIEDGGAEAKVAGPAGVVEGVIGEGVGGPRVAPLAGAPRVGLGVGVADDVAGGAEGEIGEQGARVEVAADAEQRGREQEAGDPAEGLDEAEGLAAEGGGHA